MDPLVVAVNEYINLHGKSGLYVVQNDDMFGPSLFAQNSYVIGEVVVLEKAAFITTRDLVGSMKGSDTLERLASLFKINADSSDGNLEIYNRHRHHLNTMNDAASEGMASEGGNRLKNWISAFALNGYSLSGTVKTGLFVIASKVAHSCAPNVATVTDGMADTLSFIAIKPIAKGEMIFSSYAGGNMC